MVGVMGEQQSFSQDPGSWSNYQSTRRAHTHTPGLSRVFSAGGYLARINVFTKGGIGEHGETAPGPPHKLCWKRHGCAVRPFGRDRACTSKRGFSLPNKTLLRIEKNTTPLKANTCISGRNPFCRWKRCLPAVPTSPGCTGGARATAGTGQ